MISAIFIFLVHMIMITFGVSLFMVTPLVCILIARNAGVYDAPEKVELT